MVVSCDCIVEIHGDSIIVKDRPDDESKVKSVVKNVASEATYVLLDGLIWVGLGRLFHW